jgi:hypothetical protein
MVDENKAVCVELKGVAQRSAVAHRHLMLSVLRWDRVVFHLGPVDIAHGGYAIIHDVIEARSYGLGDRLLGGDLHGFAPRLGSGYDHNGFC